MKINVEEGLDKPFLSDGRHEVEITTIDEGKSECKGVPFTACRFENEEGFVQSAILRIARRYAYPNGAMPGGIETEANQELDTNLLKGKSLY